MSCPGLVRGLVGTRTLIFGEQWPRLWPFLVTPPGQLPNILAITHPQKGRYKTPDRQAAVSSTNG